MLRTKTLLFAFVLASLISCKRNKLENQCCAAPATEISFEGGFVSIPNIFTPNNDGVFDEFTTRAEGYSSFRFEILKGKKSLFVSEDPNERWDGHLYTDKKNGFYEKKMKHGFYNFKLEMTTLGGQSISEEGEFCLVTGGSARCFYSNNNCVGASSYDGASFIQEREVIPSSCN